MIDDEFEVCFIELLLSIVMLLAKRAAYRGCLSELTCQSYIPGAHRQKKKKNSDSSTSRAGARPLADSLSL
jgi:hypothetical protein